MRSGAAANQNHSGGFGCGKGQNIRRNNVRRNHYALLKGMAFTNLRNQIGENLEGDVADIIGLLTEIKILLFGKKIDQLPGYRDNCLDWLHAVTNVAADLSDKFLVLQKQDMRSKNK